METRSRLEIMLDAIATATPIDNPRNREELLISAISESIGNVDSYVTKDVTGNVADLPKAVEDQNLLKYGFAIGDYFTGTSGYKYYIADIDTFYGGYNNNAIVNTHHIGIVVDIGETKTWNDEATTATGYAGSGIHEYLSTTVLTAIKADFKAFFGGETGAEHLISHLLSWTITNNSSAWSETAQYISLMTEPQMRGMKTVALTGSTADGEAWKCLEMFTKYNVNELVGNNNVWTRNIYSSTSPYYIPASGASMSGHGANNTNSVLALILFK